MADEDAAPADEVVVEEQPARRGRKKAEPSKPKKAKKDKRDSAATPPKPLSKRERIDLRIAEIHRSLGDVVSIRRASDRSYAYNIRRPTGILGLDIGLGGGFPAGSVCQLYGDEGVGKNMLMNYVVAQVQGNFEEDAAIAYVPLEYGFDKAFAWGCGVACPLSDKERDDFIQDRGDELTAEELEIATRSVGEFLIVDTGEKGREIPAEAKFDGVLELLGSGEFQVILIDGIGAFLGKDQRYKDEGRRRRLADTRKLGVNARLLTDFLAEVFTLLGIPNEDGSPNNTTVILNNQVRANIVEGFAAKFARKTKAGGGKALGHAKAIDLELRQVKSLKRKVGARMSKVGKVVGWECLKGKLGTHEGVEGEFEYYFATGIDLLQEAVNTGKAMGVIRSAGPKTYVPGNDKGMGKDALMSWYDDPDEAVYSERLDHLRRACMEKAGLHVRFK